MAVYVDWDYYTETYLGSAIAVVDAARLFVRASAVIDRLTFNRAAAIILADDDADLVDLIQMATCAVADELQLETGETGAGIVQSESVGRHSVTYVAGSVRTMEDRQARAAAFYLGSTGLMFRGFASDEYGGTLAD